MYNYERYLFSLLFHYQYVGYFFFMLFKMYTYIVTNFLKIK